MNIALSVVVENKKASVDVVVSPLDLRPAGKSMVVVKAIVQFKVDGKTKKTCPTSEDGLVNLELADLKVGVHTVTAMVLGQSPPVTATEDFEIEEKTKTPTGKFVGQAVMALFWAIMGLSALMFGPWTLVLLLTYLVLTLVALRSIARIKGVNFSDVVGNNDWVFWANLAMMVLSFIVAFVGGGWAFSDMALLSALGFLPSIAVSFWDEAKEVFSRGLKKHGLGGFIKHIVSWEILEEILKIPFKR